MGQRGPVPKRSSQRRRQNKESKPEKAKAASKKPKPPAAKADWHPIAKRWFGSLRRSGQSQFYEESDWAMAYLIAESISRDLKPQVVGVVEETGEIVYAVIPMKGASLAAYLKAMTSLLVTEADRRRAGIELEREVAAKPPDAKGRVARLDDYRRRASG